MEFNRLLSIWLRLQESEIQEIGKTVIEILQRLKLASKKVRDRLESPEYLALIRKSFRNWSAAESEEKRILIRNLLVNATTRTTSPDTTLSMFIDWLDNYSEEHFQVVRAIYHALPIGLARKEIWQTLNPGRKIPGEDTAEADMFKMLILDLSTGYVIRQPREKDYFGRFVRAKPARVAVSNRFPETISAFDDSKKYVLTELGKQFVFYTLEEVPPEEISEAEGILEEISV